MPSASLQSWIKNQLQDIPVIPVYAQQARLEIDKPDFDKLTLSQIIASDPGLSIQLFNLVNAKRKGTKRVYIESIQSALSLMGDAGIINFIKDITTLDDIRSSFECENDYLQLVARSQQAAKHAKCWGEKRQSQGIKEIGIATRLYDIAHFALCISDHENFKTFKQQNLTDYNPDASCQNILGFSLNELSIALCDHFHLPELVLEAHNRDEVAGIRSQGIKIACGLVHQADISWYHEKTIDYLIKAADLCQLPLEKVNSLAHICCVESARELDFKVNFHSAANLVQHDAPPRPKQLIKTIKPKAAPKAEPKLDNKPKPAIPDTQEQFLQSLKTIAQDKKTSQAVQLNALLEGCHRHLKTPRNVLILLNKDRSKMSTRLHKGLADDSALLKFSVAHAQSGLFKILLEKPQAIWINPKNFLKYDKMLPGIFKSCCLNDDFFMMSLYSGKKPVGIVFCDNYGKNIALNKTQFDLFKQAVVLTGKAMQLISQRLSKM